MSLELPLYFAVGGSYVMFLNFVSVHLEKLCIASHMIWVDEPLVHNSYVDNCSRGINCYWFFCTYYSKQLWDKIQLPCCNSYWLLYMWDKLFESFQNVALQVGSCKKWILIAPYYERHMQCPSQHFIGLENYL